MKIVLLSLILTFKVLNLIAQPGVEQNQNTLNGKVTAGGKPLQGSPLTRQEKEKLQ